jgi:hypothetical protein
MGSVIMHDGVENEEDFEFLGMNNSSKVKNIYDTPIKNNNGRIMKKEYQIQ